MLPAVADSTTFAGLHVTDPIFVPRVAAQAPSDGDTLGPLHPAASWINECPLFPVWNNGHYAREYAAPVHAAKGRRDDTGYRHGQANKVRQPARAGPPAGDAVEHVDNGHAVSRTAAPRESHYHCKKKDDKPALVILKVNLERQRSLRALVDCGSSNNFVRLQSLARLDFEELELPRSLLEVRLATGVVVRTEKCVVPGRLSYREKKLVDELIVLGLDDKLDVVLGMACLARHDPVID
ncbi:unnamed protein product [Phytophthora fragariaefolia]|uniref:Unnamed protein product n=1 Tax=Phytophthora fragariaefolia TaxID=1490495 RepID=A0A9W6WYL0_9STRA|nr:unnamed protein product [Phytophthora fragariaefolia]